MFGGIHGYGNWNLEFLFRQSMVIWVHEKLHDAAQAVYIVVKGVTTVTWLSKDPIHVCLITWPGFCLYEKLFPPSIFRSIDFWSSLSCFVLDFELADWNVIKDLGCF